MKLKAIILAAAATLCGLSASAQLGIFNHLSVGANVGTTGIGVDIAVPVTRFISIRPGYNWMPKIKPTLDFDVNVPSSAQQYVAQYNIPSSVDLEGALKFTGGKVLVDFYPIVTSGFHVTVGGYFGGDQVATLANKVPGVLQGVADYNSGKPVGDIVPPAHDPIGVELGDYLLTPDAQGNINAELKVKKFRPYAGIGFGRAIPGAPIGFMFELGAQFWGKPAVYCNGVELKDDKVGDGDAGKIIKTISKISVYPVINLRLCGKIF